MYRVFNYDNGWGNPDWESVEDAYPTGTTFSRRKDALAYAKVCGGVEDQTAEGGGVIYIKNKESGRPAFEFRREKAQKVRQITRAMHQAMESDKGC